MIFMNTVSLCQRFHKILACNSNECIWPHECLHIARNFYIIIRFVRHLISLFVSSHSFGYIFTFWQILFLIHYELIRSFYCIELLFDRIVVVLIKSLQMRFFCCFSIQIIDFFLFVCLINENGEHSFFQDKSKGRWQFYA